MTQAGLSLADKLKAMKAGRAPSPIHPPEAQFQAAQVAMAAAPQAPAAAPQMPQVPMMAPQAPPMQFSLPSPQGAPVSAVVSVMPVAQPPFPTPQVPQAAPMAPMDPALYQAPQGAVPVQAVPVVSAQAAPEPPPEPPAATKKRGRPAKATAAAQPETNGGGFTLYVGCAPIGSHVTNAFDYVNAAHDLLKESHGVTHYREMEFGKGPGLLCVALEMLLANCEGTPNAPAGDVVLGGAQIEEDTASVWFARATKVVRAFR